MSAVWGIYCHDTQLAANGESDPERSFLWPTNRISSTDLFEAVQNFRTVKQLLGHSDLKITMFVVQSRVSLTIFMEKLCGFIHDATMTSSKRGRQRIPRGPNCAHIRRLRGESCGSIKLELALSQ